MQHYTKQLYIALERVVSNVAVFRLGVPLCRGVKKRPYQIEIGSTHVRDPNSQATGGGGEKEPFRSQIYSIQDHDAFEVEL